MRLDLEALEGRWVPSGSPVAVDDSYTVPHDRTTIVSPLDNDTADAGATLTASVVSYPAHAYVVFNNDNTLTIEPNIGYVGADWMTYKLNDGNADSNTATITLTVTNTAPTASDLGPLTVHQGASLTGIDLAAAGSDADGDPLTARVVTQPAHGSLWQDFSTGLWGYDSYGGFVGTDTATFVVNDGAADSNPVAVSFSVTDTAPVASDLGPFTLHHDTSVTGINLLAAASDADSDSLSARVVTQPAHGSLWQDWYTGQWNYTPYIGYVGPDSATFVANDGAMVSNVATISFNVTNTPPTAVDQGPFAIWEGQAVTGINLLAGASDADGDPLSAQPVTQSAHGWLNYNYSTGLWDYYPNSGYVGTDSFSFVVSDGAANSNTATVSFNIANPISITSPGDQRNDAGDSVDITIPASSQISGPLTWDITGLPDGVTANPETGEITGTINPGAETNSPYLVTASVTDVAGNIATATFNWVVALPLTVTTRDDNAVGDPTIVGSLRDVIERANSADATDVTVRFNPNVTGTITLQSALPSLRNNITIRGPGSDTLTITCNTSQALFNIFQIYGSWSCEFDDLTFSGGNTNDGGGAIYNEGTLTVQRCRFEDNTAAGDGGAIYNNGILNASNCSFYYNTSSSGDGGAISNGTSNAARLFLTSCTLQTNNASGNGGAIENWQGMVRIGGNTQIIGNWAGRVGGGIYNARDLQMNGGVISDNLAYIKPGDPLSGCGGGYYGEQGIASFLGVDFEDNSAESKGGGFYLRSGTLGLSGCSIGVNLANTAGTAGPGGYVQNGATYNPPVNCTINDQVTMGP